MTWRTGFFRVWVLLAITWVCIMTAFFYEEIASPSFAPRAFYYSSTVQEGPWIKYAAQAELDRRAANNPTNLRPRSVERYSDGYRTLEEGRSAGALQVVEFQDFPEISLYAPTDLAVEELQRRAGEVHDIATDIKATVLRKRRIAALQNAALAMLLPPLGLLVVGAGIGWALSGFRVGKMRN